MELENINPSVYKKSNEREITQQELDENYIDLIDSREVFGNLNYIFIISFNHYLLSTRFNQKYK